MRTSLRLLRICSVLALASGDDALIRKENSRSPSASSGASNIAQEASTAWPRRGRKTVEETMSTWSERRNCIEVDAGIRNIEREKLVVAMATDAPDLVPAFAVINSTVTHSRNASIVLFTTRKRQAVAALRRLRQKLASDARIRVCDGLDVLLRKRPALNALQGLAARSPNTTLQRIRRQELLSPFNFAAFYLAHCLRNVDEILYLDTDTVVRKDVFAEVPLLAGQRGKAVAAVEDCSQRLGKYINFLLLRKFLSKTTIGDLTAERFPAPVLEEAVTTASTRSISHAHTHASSAHNKQQRLVHTINSNIKKPVQRTFMKKQELDDAIRSTSRIRHEPFQQLNPARSTVILKKREDAHNTFRDRRRLMMNENRRKQVHSSANQAFVSEETCVFNRGVVAINAERWRANKLSETIEELIMLYVKSKARLWRGGVSQPPFLLALAGRYRKLPLEWNVRGLGRVDLGHLEMDSLRHLVASKRPKANTSLVSLSRHVSHVAHFDKWSPFIAPLAPRAAVLHYTGEVKPWRIARFAAIRPDLYGITVTSQGHVDGHCRLTDTNNWQAKQADENASSVTQYFASGCFAKFPLCACSYTSNCVEACAYIWHRYVSDDARQVLFNARVGSPLVLPTDLGEVVYADALADGNFKNELVEAPKSDDAPVADIKEVVEFRRHLNASKKDDRRTSALYRLILRLIS